MKRRVLVTSYEVPDHGGAATSAYTLFAKLQREGVDAHYLSVVERIDLPFFQWFHGADVGNPDRLPNVGTCVVETPLYRRHPALVDAVARIAPDVVLARGYIAALVVKTAAPEVPVILSVAGSSQAEFMIVHGRAAQAVDLSRLKSRYGRQPTRAPGRETAALDAVDLVLANSDLTQALLAQFSGPAQTCKVYPEPIWGAEWIAESVARLALPRTPFAERRIDVLFVAGSWTRSVKNLPMVERIVRRLPNLRIALVGDSERRLPGVEHHARIADRRALLTLIGEARAVVAPSRIDACPNVLFEASLMGCNVVTSKNCGNWMLCNPALLVDPPAEDGFVVAAERAARAPHPDNMAWFYARRSYDQLLEILGSL